MGEELKEKLFNQKENGWESVNEQKKKKYSHYQKNIWNF